MNIRIIGLKDKRYEISERRKVSDTIRRDVNDAIFIPITENEFDRIIKKEEIHEKVKDGEIILHNYCSDQKTFFTKLDKLIPNLRNRYNKDIEPDDDKNVEWISETMIGTILTTSINLDLPIVLTEKEAKVSYPKEQKISNRIKTKYLAKSKIKKHKNPLFTNGYNMELINNNKKISSSISQEIRNYDSLNELYDNYTIVLKDIYLKSIYRELKENPNNIVEYKLL